MAHVRLNQALLLQQHSSTAVTWGVAGGHATSVIQFQAGGDESRLRRQRYDISDYSHCTATNRCKQSGDRFLLANGRCLNEFWYSFRVYTENETENKKATSFSAVNESDRNQHKLPFSATKTTFGRTLLKSNKRTTYTTCLLCSI